MEQINEKVRVRQAPWEGLVYVAAGLLLLGWLLNTPEGLTGKADAIGYAVCHRIDARSFHIGSWATPLCARCSGMYLGAVLGLFYQQLVGPRRWGAPPWRVIAVLVVLVAAFAVDGLNSYLHFFPGAPTLYEPQNWSRLLTGTGMGLVLAAAIFPAFNQTVWSNTIPGPAITGIRSFVLLLGLATLLDVLVLMENPLILYPLALVSAGGVLLLLTMIYTMVWIMILRRENRYQKIRQMVLPLVGGFTLALAQIAAIDFVRYLLTGTWGGFHIG